MIRIAMVLACLAAPALAEPDRLSILLGSHHVDTSLRFEERNPGLFLTWEDRGGVDLSLGAYRNSFGDLSVAATVALPLIRHGDFDLSAFVGIASYGDEAARWPVHAGPLVPIGGLQARWNNIFVQVLPDRGNPDATVTFGVTFPIGGY